MIETPVLTQTETEDGALLLLSSSTIVRYSQVAKQLASRSQLKQRMVADPSMIREIVSYGRAQWCSLANSKQREVPEIEIAILLCLLVETGSPEVDALLSDVGLNNRPAVAWLAALARDLRTQRSTNTQKTMANALNHLLPWGLVASAAIDLEQIISGDFSVTTPIDKASQSSLKLAA